MASASQNPEPQKKTANSSLSALLYPPSVADALRLKLGDAQGSLIDLKRAEDKQYIITVKPGTDLNKLVLPKLSEGQNPLEPLFISINSKNSSEEKFSIPSKTLEGLLNVEQISWSRRFFYGTAFLAVATVGYFLFGAHKNTKELQHLLDFYGATNRNDFGFIFKHIKDFGFKNIKHARHAIYEQSERLVTPDDKTKLAEVLTKVSQPLKWDVRYGTAHYLIIESEDPSCHVVLGKDDRIHIHTNGNPTLSLPLSYDPHPKTTQKTEVGYLVFYGFNGKLEIEDLTRTTFFIFVNSKADLDLSVYNKSIITNCQINQCQSELTLRVPEKVVQGATSVAEDYGIMYNDPSALRVIGPMTTSRILTVKEFNPPRFEAFDPNRKNSLIFKSLNDQVIAELNWNSIRNYSYEEQGKDLTEWLSRVNRR